MPSLTQNLNIIARCTQMQRGKALSALGLCGGQVPYLLRLCREPGLTQEALARCLCVNKSTAARQISALEKLGLVDRRLSETDRRCVCLYPTEKALGLRPQVLECVRDWNEYLLEDLSEDERSRAETVLNRLAERARRYVEEEVGWDA